MVYQLRIFKTSLDLFFKLYQGCDIFFAKVTALEQSLFCKLELRGKKLLNIIKYVKLQVAITLNVHMLWQSML